MIVKHHFIFPDDDDSHLICWIVNRLLALLYFYRIIDFLFQKIKFHFSFWLKGRALHIFYQTILQLVSHWTSILIIHIDTANYQFTLTHLRFKHQTQVAVLVEIIHHTHQNLDIILDAIQLHGSGILA